MRKFVGVKSWFEVALYPSLKRDALLFDQIAIPDYKHLPPFLAKRREVGEEYVNELEWLRENGIIFEPARRPSDPKIFISEEYQQYRDLEMKELDSLIEFLDKQQKEIEEEMGLNFDPNDPIPQHHLAELIRRTLTHNYNVAEHRVRRFSLQLRMSEGIDAYPLLQTEIHSFEENEAKKTDVVQVVFDAFPIPDDATSWEAILDYRRDSNSQKKFADLRHWMNKFANGKMTMAEAQEEVEYLMNEYENHLSFHKLKIRTIALGVVLQFGAAYLDRKVGPIATGIATYMIGRLGLLEGESKAPGKEVAYIVDTKNRFS